MVTEELANIESIQVVVVMQVVYYITELSSIYIIQVISVKLV